MDGVFRHLTDRLDNPKISKLELTQRKAFIETVKNLKINKNMTALSVSVGDGVWDYLSFISNKDIKKIYATEVIDCPVSSESQQLLESLGEWEFIKVDKDGILPFEDGTFDFVYHLDVVEHTAKPFLFLKEQLRVLKKGGTIFIGTPNLFRPANILKLLTGKLSFPVKILEDKNVGVYLHIQEFYEEQMKVLMEEVGFRDITVSHCFWGIPFLRLTFSMYPKCSIGKSTAHFLAFTAKK